MLRADLFKSAKFVHAHSVIDFVKSSTDNDERLRREALVLEHVAYPSIPKVVSVVTVNGTTELHTERIDGYTLAAIPKPLPSSTSLTIFRGLATTLDHVHRRGVAHRRIDANHVIVRSNGQPVLCGFAEATPMPQDDESLAVADVADLGRLMLSLLPNPLDRLRIRITAINEEDLSAERKVASLARLATEQKLSSSELVARLEAAPAVTESGSQDSDLSRRLRPVFIAATIFLIGSGIALLQSSSGETSTKTERVTELVVESPEAPQQPGILVIGDETYSLGNENDGLLVGRWTCENDLPALLRKRDGTVWTFTSWPGHGREVRGRQVSNVTGAVDIDEESKGACDELVIRAADGKSTYLSLKEF